MPESRAAAIVASLSAELTPTLVMPVIGQQPIAKGVTKIPVRPISRLGDMGSLPHSGRLHSDRRAGLGYFADGVDQRSRERRAGDANFVPLGIIPFACPVAQFASTEEVEMYVARGAMLRV